MVITMLLSKTNRRFSRASRDGACPRCGGVSFKAKRSGFGLLSLGLLARKTRVRCETCGYQMRRG
jgi:hypothetical protein